MAKLGFRDDIKSLSSFKAECFSVISNKLSELERNKSKSDAEKAKAKNAKR